MEAILLRRVRFSDTSWIITWLSDEQGKLKTIAKGALRPGSPFAGKLDLFYQVELLLIESKRSEIHTLKEVSILNSFENIRASYLKTLAAGYFSELIEDVTEPEHPVPEIYHLLFRALRFLDENQLELRAISFFESELCRFLGIQSGYSEGAAQTLQATFGRLPPSRKDLLAKLNQRSGNA